MFGLWQPRYRYNLLKNVRIDTSDLKVYRKYTKIQNGRLVRPYWLLVDYKTTHQLAEPRPCPLDKVAQTLKTAF